MHVTPTVARLAMEHPSWPLWRCQAEAARIDAGSSR